MGSFSTTVLATIQAVAPAAAPNTSSGPDFRDSTAPTSLQEEFRPTPDNRAALLASPVAYQASTTSPSSTPSRGPDAGTGELLVTIDPRAKEQQAIIRAVSDAKAADTNLKVVVAPKIMNGEGADTFVVGSPAIAAKWDISSIATPSEDAGRWTLNNLYVHPSYRPAAGDAQGSNKLEVAAFALESNTEGDQTTVKMVDYLRVDDKSKQPLEIFNRTFSNNVKEEREQARAALAEALITAWHSGKEERQKFLDDIKPTANRKPGYLVEPSGTPLEQTTKSELSRLAAEDAIVRVAVTPLGARVDRLFTESTVIALSGEALLKLEQEFKINGLVDFVNVEVPGSPRKDGSPGFETKIGRIVNAPVNARPDASGPLLATTMVTDKFGNVYSYYIHPGNASSSPSLNISTYPARALSHDGESRSTPFSLDLSSLGLGPIEGLAQQPSLARENPRAPAGSYALFVDVPDLQQKEKIEPFYPVMINGTGKAEDLFGLPRTSIVKNIVVANSAGINASFNPQLPNNIRIQDKALTDQPTVAGVAAHEAYHALDNKFNLSTGKFEEQFNKIKASGAEGEKFFAALNESRFRSDMTYGGHSQANRYEFVASFINSITEPRFAEVMARQTPAFRQSYRETLDALSYQIKMNPEIAADAPVHKLIAERRKLLEE